MTSEDLSKLQADYFNQLAGKPLAFQAKATDDVAEAVAEKAGLVVFVLPWDESEEAIDAVGSCREELVTSVVVNAAIEGNFTRLTGLRFSKWLRLQLAGTAFALEDTDGEFVWEINDMITYYDKPALKRKQFLQLFRPVFYNFA